MDMIDRENKYTKVNYVNGFLITGVKHWYLKLSYSYSYIFTSVYVDIGKVDTKVPLLSIKKMRIMSMGIIAIVFFILAAMAFGFGFIRGRDQVTGEMGSSNVLTGTIIALILAGLGILYLRSKTGRLKILQTNSIKGSLPRLIYASPDIEELKSLRELIKNQQSALVSGTTQHQPPPLPK